MADTETPVKTTIPVQNAAQAAESYLHSLQGFMGGRFLIFD